MPSVVLPIPPSVNNLWRLVRKVKSKASFAKSKEYATWLDEAILLLRMGFPKVTVFPVAVHVTIFRGAGWRKGRDADNTLKAIADSLVKAERLPDDNEDFITEFKVRIGPVVAKAFVLVCVTTPEIMEFVEAVG